MRALLALLLLAPPLAAQERTNRFAVFVSQPATDGADGFGVAFEKRFTERWSAELAVSREEYTASGIFPGSAEFDVETIPVDLTVRFDFRTPSTRWRPFLGGGARWVDPTSDSPAYDYGSRISAQVIGGVDFNITDIWSLRADAKQLLRLYDQPYDNAFKVSLGACVRF